ncbi:MAG: arginyltransferase [Gammaproteobacteria bacterium]
MQAYNRDRIGLFLSQDSACSYLPQRQARNLLVTPSDASQECYSHLIALGFRRSGAYIYRPHCLDCAACIPLRIPISAFQPNRAQRRCQRANADVRLSIHAATFSAEHYQLYQRYLDIRHPHGGMDNEGSAGYRALLHSPWQDTRLWEFRADGRLLGVSIVDHFDNSLSAVYTFFDPDEERRGLGTYAILRQIAEARRQALSWLYLGYWIAENKKMAYKHHLRPYQLFRAGHWRDPVSRPLP